MVVVQNLVRAAFAVTVFMMPAAFGQVRPRTAATAPKPAINRSIERIASVEVRGSKLYKSEELTPIAELTVGSLLNKAELDAARARLSDTKLFAEVNYEYKTSTKGNGVAADVTFQVSDYPERYTLHFDRLGKSDEELKALLRERVPLYREPLPYSPWLLEQVRLAINQVTVPVASRITGDNPREQFLLIYPKGAPPVVAEVRFIGSEVITRDELIFAMRGTAVGIEYREGLFRELLNLGIVPLYEARGRIRVSFPKIEVEPAKDVPGFVVTTTVVEGPSYDISAISIAGAEGDRMNRDLTRASMLKVGDLANMEEVRAAEKRMLTVVKRAGYLDATSTVDRAIDDDKHQVAITFRFEPRDQYVFGRLTLKGLDIVTEPAIKKMWAPEPGKPFNPEYPEAFLSRIKEQRLMDNLKETKATVTPNKTTHVVDVTLEFR